MIGSRRWRVVATLLVLLSGAGCTPDPAPAPASAPSTPPPAASSTPASTASPDPSSAAPSESASPDPTPAAPTPSTPVESTVAPKPEVSKTPVELDKPSTTGGGLTAKLVSVRGIEAKARFPGEISGPALAVTVEVTNTGAKAADLSSVVVNLVDSDAAPGAEMTAAPAQPLSGRVAAKRKARGVYVFRVARDKRRPVTVTVSISDAPVLVFTGNA